MSTVIDNGLIVDNATNPPTAIGYIFNFEGKGAYAPDGKVKVGDAELTQAQVDEHNRLLGEMEKQAAIERGKAVFYFSYDVKRIRESDPMTRNNRRYENYRVSNWCGSWKSPHCHVRRGYSYGYGRFETFWIWFTGPDGKQWYGVLKGDMQCFNARRLKKQG